MSRMLRISLSACTMFLFLFVACAPRAPAAPSPDMSAAMTEAVAPVYAGATQTAQAVPAASETPAAAPTAVRTPPALPAGFSTDLLNPLDTPHTYIPDACQYLKAK